MASLFIPRGMGSLLFVASLLCSLGTAFGQATCMPTLEIQISLPKGSQVTQKFGETDHYLAATVDTVTWGYYDPNATPRY
jgi:hypothetical protein